MSELERLMDAAKRGDYADVSAVLRNHAELIKRAGYDGRDGPSLCGPCSPAA